MLKSPVIFLFPLIPILPLLFPGLTTNFGKAALTFGLQGLENEHERLLLRMTLWAFAFLAFAVLIGFDRGGSEYMHPLFLPAVLLAVALAKHQHYSACQIYAYEATILVSTLIIIGFRIFALFIGPPICGSCETWARFEPLADALRLAGAENATILTTDRMTAGNSSPTASAGIRDDCRPPQPHPAAPAREPHRAPRRHHTGRRGRQRKTACPPMPRPEQKHARVPAGAALCRLNRLAKPMEVASAISLANHNVQARRGLLGSHHSKGAIRTRAKALFLSRPPGTAIPIRRRESRT